MVDTFFKITYDTNIKKQQIIIAIFSVFSGLFLSLLIYKFSFLHTLLILAGLFVVFLIFKFPDLGLVLSFSSAIFKEWLTEITPIFASFDFTIAIFGVTFLSIMFSLLKKGTIFYIKLDKSFLPLFLFTIYLIFSTFYTPSFYYGNLKAFSFLTFNLSLFVAPILLIDDERYAWRMIYFLIVLGVIISIYSLVDLIHSILTLSIIYTFRATFLEVNSIGYANWIGSINILLIAILPTIKEKKWRRLAICTIILFAITLLVTNSRGPLLSFIITCLMIFLFRLKEMSTKKIALILVSIIVFILLILIILPPQLIDRYIGMVNQDQLESKRVAFYTINTRLDFWKACLNSASESFRNLIFGIGSGGFSKMYYHRDFTWYPHNIFLEVLCELGLVGVILLCWHFILIFKTGVQTLFQKLQPKQKNLMLAYLMAAFFNFMAAQFSGDLNRNRKLWLFFGVIAAIAPLITKNRNTQIQYE